MNGLFNKIAIASLLAAGITTSSFAQEENSFDNKNIRVSFEKWEVIEDKYILVTSINNSIVLANDSISPDLSDFSADKSVNLWSIDFNNRVIKLVFTSATQPGLGSLGRLWIPAMGFHLEDIDGTLPEIVGVKVNDQYAPNFFHKDFVKFDSNNIYVSLQGSMCEKVGWEDLPDCNNLESPTGYNNTIEIEVMFVGDLVDNEEIDQLFTWAEGEYPNLFPNHVESEDMFNYHARSYPETKVYLGVKDQRVYYYDVNTVKLNDLGSIDDWMKEAEMSKSQ